MGMVSEGISWETAKDYEFKLDYPKSGNGFVVTHVQIVAQQVSQSAKYFRN